LRKHSIKTHLHALFTISSRFSYPQFRYATTQARHSYVHIGSDPNSFYMTITTIYSLFISSFYKITSSITATRAEDSTNHPSSLRPPIFLSRLHSPNVPLLPTLLVHDHLRRSLLLRLPARVVSLLPPAAPAPFCARQKPITPLPLLPVHLSN
jgi:hypothetical protein